MIDGAIKGCDKCQRNKITGSKNYGKVPPADDKKSTTLGHGTCRPYGTVNRSIQVNRQRGNTHETSEIIYCGR